MSTMDEQIGKNLARLRGDVSQKDLAKEMKRRGWKWSQATVWTVETGERPLRLSEAQDVADILEENTMALLRTDDDFKLMQEVRQAQIAMEDISEAKERFEDLAQSITKRALTSGGPLEGSPEIMDIINTLNGPAIRIEDIAWRNLPAGY